MLRLGPQPKPITEKHVVFIMDSSLATEPIRQAERPGTHHSKASYTANTILKWLLKGNAILSLATGFAFHTICIFSQLNIFDVDQLGKAKQYEAKLVSLGLQQLQMFGFLMSKL